jgi:hypothetical protein
MTFIKDIVAPGKVFYPKIMLWSWVALGAALTAVLFSFFSSNMAMRKAIRQVDNGTIRDERTGGNWAVVTMACNVIGGILFIVGVILLISFVYLNFGRTA